MRRILAGVSTEKVKIIKPDQCVIENVDALVQREKIFVDDGTLNIEEGDIIERTLPSGSKEKYLVEDRGFFREMNGIASHYQIKVKKQNPYSKSNSGRIVNNYNITNAEKVNINSTDNSVNISANDIAVMDTLRGIAKGLDNEAEVISCINAMQENIGKKSFAEKYNNFIQSVANHMTIFGPLIPTLTKLLAQ